MGDKPTEFEFIIAKKINLNREKTKKVAGSSGATI